MTIRHVDTNLINQQIVNLERQERIKWEYMKNVKVEKELQGIKRKQLAEIIKHNSKLKQGITDLRKQKLKEIENVSKRYRNKFADLEKKYKSITVKQGIRLFNKTLTKGTKCNSTTTSMTRLNTKFGFK
jgi:hypothetical protein